MSRVISQSLVSDHRVAVPSIATFDPAAVPLAPELAPRVFGWVRRFALQAELPAADRLLRDALAELVEALSITVLYVGPDGAHALDPDEQPLEPAAVAHVVASRQTILRPHLAYVPVVAAGQTIAVVQLQRTPHQKPFDALAAMMMSAIARESATIIHHLLVEHHRRAREHEADGKTLYRPEALANHRRRGQDGTLTELSPHWVRATYYVLIAAIVSALGFATCVHVPAYSSGRGVVVFDGTRVTAPMAGTVEAVYVQGGQTVEPGDPLVKLASDTENAALRQATTELDTTIQQYLFDRTDEAVRKQMASAVGTVARAQDAVDQRTVLAKTAGTISDVRIRAGIGIELGAPILSVLAPGTQPEVWAYLPGSDRPRFRVGMPLQVELEGYQKTRETATIYEIGRDVVGGGEVKRTLGAELADSLQLSTGASYVVVKSRLATRTFRAKGREFRFFPGMPAKTDVKIEDKRFIATLLPSLEDYLP